MRRGYSRGQSKTTVRYQCKSCGRYRTGESTHRSARILLIDIETAPMEFYGWSPRQDYIPHTMVIKDWSVLCYGAKWLFEPEIVGESVKPKEATAREDKSILQNIWKLLNEADIVVTQNGIQFDIKKLNSRFLRAGFAPPSPYRNVDTKVILKNVFGESYNKLDWVGKEVLGLDGKIDMEFNDWRVCVEPGKLQEAYLEKMLAYCKNDVAPLLEDSYLRILPWTPNHPNLNLYTLHDDDVCPKCESSELDWGEKYPTPAGVWRGFKCTSCGAVGRGKGEKNKIKSSQVA